jgi:hypothetical protein
MINKKAENQVQIQSHILLARKESKHGEQEPFQTLEATEELAALAPKSLCLINFSLRTIIDQLCCKPRKKKESEEECVQDAGQTHPNQETDSMEGIWDRRSIKIDIRRGSLKLMRI